MKRNSATSITPENAKVENVVEKKKLPPYCRFVSIQHAEACKLSEVEPVI
jgi:hypothetical protein